MRYDDDVDLRDIIANGRQVAQPIRYSDDRWRLAGHPTGNARRQVVPFHRVPERWRPLVKDWVLLLTNPHLATIWSEAPVATAHASQKPRAWSTAVTRTSALASALRMMEERRLISLGEAEWHHVREGMLSITSRYRGRTRSVSVEAAARLGGTLRALHDTGPIHGYVNPFGSRPWGTRDINAAIGYSAPPIGERRNRFEPHAHVGALLGASIFMLENLAQPIISRVEWWWDRPAIVQRLENGALPRGAWAHIYEHYTKAAGDLPLVATKWTGFNRAIGDRNHRAVRMFAGLEGDGKRVQPSSSTASRGRWALGADPYPIGLTAVRAVDDSEKAWADHLLPGDGLELWADRLVFVAYYVIAATTGLRKREIDALKPDCITYRKYHGEQRAVMSGFLLKGKSGTPRKVEWFVNDHVVRAVDFLNRLADLYGAERAHHPRTGQPCLITYQLTQAPLMMPDTERAQPLRFDAKTIERYVFAAAKDLADRGVLPPVDDLEICNATTIRNTAMDAFTRERLGDAVAAAMGYWMNMHTAYGYMGRAPSTMLGRRPKVVMLADPEEARERASNQDAADLLREAAERPETLTGDAAPSLVATANSHLGPINTPVSEAALLRAAKKTKDLRFGWLSACTGGAGGKCNDDDEVNERLCQLGCRNQVLTRYHRAKLEYGRRMLSRLGPVGSRFGVKLDELAPEVLSEFNQTSDAELVQLLTEGWPDSVRKAVFDD